MNPNRSILYLLPLLGLVAGAGLMSPVQGADFAGTTVTSPLKPNRASVAFFSLEGWTAGGIQSAFENELTQAMTAVREKGITASGSVSATSGVGARLGIMLPLRRQWDVGGSIGYVLGPNLSESVDLGPLVYLPTGTYYPNGHAGLTMQTTFARALIEGGKRIPLGRGVSLRLGLGAGLGVGRINQTKTVSGSAVPLFGTVPFDDQWTGFTWEISPSLIWSGDWVDLELGGRFSQFPIRRSDSNAAKIDWQPLGVFLTLRFNFAEDEPSRAVFQLDRNSTYMDLVNYFLDKAPQKEAHTDSSSPQPRLDPDLSSQ